MHSHERQTAAIVAEKELADVDSLQAEGLEIVSRITANITRYQEARRQLRAKSGTFSGQLGMEARRAINQMDQTLSEQLTLILKQFR